VDFAHFAPARPLGLDTDAGKPIIQTFLHPESKDDLREAAGGRCRVFVRRQGPGMHFWTRPGSGMSELFRMMQVSPQGFHQTDERIRSGIRG
jgi:hypothetical protein